MTDTFEIQGLHVNIEEKEILKGVDLVVRKGEVHALMGPNGSGKSTLANAILGHPKYTVTSGTILMKGENILEMETDERARKGLFLAFQYPCEVPGVRQSNFLRLACNARAGHELDVTEFYAKLEEKMKVLDIDEKFMKRYLNAGFSGGEKKRNEILQMMMLQPEFAVMDETDSGLDIDALKVVSHGVNELRGPGLGILIITHYERILRYINPDYVHILVDGKIVKSGGADLAAHLEEHGYDWIIKDAEPAAAPVKAKTMSTAEQTLPGAYKEGFHDDLKSLYSVPKGPTHAVIDYMCDVKAEPAWMREFRHRSLDIFLKKDLPAWMPGLRDIDYDAITYYMSPVDKSANKWEDVPEEIRRTYDKLGIAKEEQKLLGGLGAQIDSEMAYHNIQESLSKKGVVFLSCDEGMKQYPDIFKEHFAKSIPPEDNKFAALNSAFWSGGSFVYIPKGIKCDVPLSVYFRINAEQFGQFERTLIICEDDSFCHYVEGCSAPVYTTHSVHAAVVEIFVKDRARCRYTTIQNWSTDVYNLVTKRAYVYKNGVMEWVDGNLGSKRTVKYPSCYMVGEGAHGEILSLASADKGMWQDAGAKLVFYAPNCTGRINSKSITGHGGRASYRGLVQVNEEATNCRVQVNCDALILDQVSRSDTYPVMEIDGDLATVEHEASVSNVSEEQLFYLMSRGVKKEDAVAMIVNGFIEPIVKELPMEFAVEINRLINLQMEGSVG